MGQSLSQKFQNLKDLQIQIFLKDYRLADSTIEYFAKQRPNNIVMKNVNVRTSRHLQLPVSQCNSGITRA